MILLMGRHRCCWRIGGVEGESEDEKLKEKKERMQMQMDSNGQKWTLRTLPPSQVNFCPLESILNKHILL